EQEQLGAGPDGGDRDPLSLADAEVPWVSIEPRLESRRSPGRSQLLPYRGLEEEAVGVLGHVADPSLDPDPTAIRREDTSQELEHGALARAVAAHEHGQLAAAEAEARTGESAAALVGKADAGQLGDGRRGLAAGAVAGG